ncbi:MAG: hypothetical protein J6D28_01840 [Bacilli bacterium]|nr:hypothetical protein [Bacilli bacterium]
MTLDIQFKIRNNVYYQRYIREHSYWYKVLNRNSNMFRNFEEKVKEDYKLRTSDKITKMLSTIEMFQNVVSSLK